MSEKERDRGTYFYLCINLPVYLSLYLSIYIHSMILLHTHSYSHMRRPKDAVHIMEMYNMAIDCTGNGDNICEEAWVFVALHFHLPHPSHRHH